MVVKHVKQAGLPADEGDPTHVEPTDWYAAHRTGTPDDLPASPSAYDDEFDALSGWTTLGTLDISNVTDVPGQWHAKRTTTTAEDINGIYKACPSMPFTVTAKLADIWTESGNAYAGLMLLEASPGHLYTFGPVYGSGYGGWNDLFRAQYSNRTTRTGQADSNGTTYAGVGLYPPFYPYVRLVVTSSTNFALYVSAKGRFWNLVVSGETTTGSGSWTIANVGLFVGGVNGAVTIEAYFDWIRFT